MDRLPAVVRVLEEIASQNHPQRVVEARGILVQLDFVGCLVLFRKVWSDSKFLSHTVCSSLQQLTILETMLHYHSEAVFGEVCTETLDTC